MEWPPGSGRQRQFPEIARAGWFELAEAKERIHKAQRGFLEQLRTLLTA
jgi:predicted NUDIX family NTP pyrophosphohydrolase